MGHRTRWIGAAFTAVAVAAAAPQVASAAAPTATTGGAAPVTFSTALLHGAVDPNGHATNYFFQYGPTTLYGGQTAPASAGSGHANISVTAPISALIPDKTYHYRVVAQYSGGLVKGKDRTFKTHRQPLGFSAAAVPNPVGFGTPLTISGTLTGTGNVNRAVVLQGRSFPYTSPFIPSANTQQTNAQGGFSFPILGLTISSQFQVYLRDNPRVATPVITVGVAYVVSGHASSHHVKRGRSVRFSGTLRPGVAAVKIVIQRKHRSRWSTVGTTISHRRPGASSAKYSKRVRIRRGGSYRVEARSAGGDYASGASAPFTIHTHR
jgi:hypothetical protein